ncbi:response regulator transcription factor, partial [Streptomyces sp. NPDC002265]|uniref:response regulator transcription factor n=1 Tax=Streptomyces sp. NPDC002265 TaxID=3154415 RepID=UPI003323E021
MGTVAEGDAVISPRVTRRLLDRFARLTDQEPPAVPRSLDALTARELDVLRAMTRGLSDADIALELHVSEATVKSHVAHILDRCRLGDRVRAVILAYGTGLVRPTVGPLGPGAHGRPSTRRGSADRLLHERTDPRLHLGRHVGQGETG